jgi:hypothetical protein
MTDDYLGAMQIFFSTSSTIDLPKRQLFTALIAGHCDVSHSGVYR